VPVTPPPQLGRDRPEWVVAINRNSWSQSIGISGRNQPVRPHKSAVGGIKIVRRAEDVASSLTASIEAIKILAPHASNRGLPPRGDGSWGIGIYHRCKERLSIWVGGYLRCRRHFGGSDCERRDCLVASNRELALEMVCRVTGDRKSPFSNCLSDAIVKIAAIAEAIGDR
jgi:hypothetical protein